MIVVTETKVAQHIRGTTQTRKSAQLDEVRVARQFVVRPTGSRMILAEDEGLNVDDGVSYFNIISYEHSYAAAVACCDCCAEDWILMIFWESALLQIFPAWLHGIPLT
jgi:hypothetical protein